MTGLAGEIPRKAKPRGFSALWRSYLVDLRRWVARLVTGYGIAAALMLGGLLAIFGAITVGAMALFHFIALRYGTNIAFAALGGGLFALAVALLFAGWLLMSRPAPPLPKPRLQLRAAREMLVGTTISRAVTAQYDTEGGKPDVTTQILLGAAVIMAVGWLVTSHAGPTAARMQVRQ